jgi:hypothetical protein
VGRHALLQMTDTTHPTAQSAHEVSAGDRR